LPRVPFTGAISLLPYIFLTIIKNYHWLWNLCGLI
jgi:hypothetical protein